jgi:hypothetical protein
MAKHQTTRQPKATRRIRVGIRWLEPYGIERGDRAIVVMNGDVRLGELGYFCISHSQQGYNQFAFVCEQDSTCHDNYYAKKREIDSVCLRESLTGKCRGFHHATTYGRVCAVERGTQTVEANFSLRPYDEVADAGEITSLNNARSQKTAPTEKQEATKKQEVSVDDLHPGDLVAVHQYLSKEPLWTGYFKEADETNVYVQEASGKTYWFPRHPIFQLYRLGAEQSERDAQIEMLKQRAARLTHIHEESEKFQVLKQIYDLERETSADADEWPDEIAA